MKDDAEFALVEIWSSWQVRHCREKVSMPRSSVTVRASICPERNSDMPVSARSSHFLKIG